MAPYNQYNNFYDPVGSQSNQPSGYTYQHPPPTSGSQYPSAAATTNYASDSYPSYGTGYNAQQYGSGGQQPTAEDTGTNRVAAAALSSLSGQDYNTSRSNSTQQQYDGYNSAYSSQSYAGSSLQAPSRSNNTASPSYPTSATPSSTFGSLSYNAPSAPTQRSSSTYGQQSTTPAYGQQGTSQNYPSTNTNTSTAHSYQPSYATSNSQAQGQTEPQRYASPLQAVRAQQQQQSHSAHSSRHQPSPQIHSQPAPAQINRQQTASVEPASTTVDPSQVYDFRAEREKKAKIEAEKRRKIEEAEATCKAEQDRIDAEKRDEARRQKEADEARKQEEALRVLAKREKQVARVEKMAAQGAAKKAEQRRKEEEQRLASENNQSETAANALTQMASSGSDAHLPPPANAEEAEMREMFKKMREFNSRNPAMLAKLWEEERHSHAVSQSPQPAQAAPSASLAHQPAPAHQHAPAHQSAPAQQPAPATPSVPNTSAPRAAAPPATKPFIIHRKHAQPHAAGKKTPAEKAQEKAQSQTPVPAQSTSQGSGSSLWPPGKKGFLAEIAAQWLSSRNPGRTVTKQEVLDNLDKNPNYVQLCEALEGLGLKFERAGFARELLRAVPSSTQASQNTPKPAEAAMMNANGTVSQANGTADGQPPKRKRGRPKGSEAKMRDNFDWKPLSNGTVNYEMPSFSLTAAAQRLNNMDRVPAPSPNQARQPVGGPVQPPQADDSFISIHDDTPPPPASPKPDLKPASPPRPPADKEEAARKRGFGDLVDLTAGDSEDEESAPPKKMMQITQGQSAHGLAFTQRQNADGSMGKRNWTMPYGLPQQAFSQQPPMPAARMLPSQGAVKSPSIPPPPGQFQQPSQPVQTVPLPQPKRKGPSQEQLQHERIRGKMVVEPIMRDRVARKSTYDVRTIARDVLLATGRHPDMRALNSHMNPMQRLLGERGGMLDLTGNKADLSTIRWDIIDPEPVKKAAIADDKPLDIDTGDADDEDDMPAPVMPSMARQQAVDGGDGTMRYISVFDANPPIKIPKKRGRKPRHSAPGGDSLAPGPRDASGTARQSVQPRAAPNTAPANRAAASPVADASPAPSGAVGYAAFRKVDANGNPIKTKGRPVGWRKSVHSREAQGLTPAKPGSKAPGKSSARKESPLQEPKYQVYKCRWLECKAELHSLDTLKKHIVKVHGDPDSEGVHSCLWQGCTARSSDSARNGKAKARTAAFTEIEHWINHIDKEHLQDIAYKLGDGPRGGQSDHPESDASEAYLSDSHGRSVTPIIRPFEALNTIGEGGSSRVAPTPVQRSRAREDAEREIGKLADRKRAVGAVLDRQGVRFANAKRRLGFLDDEDFEDIVESEGDADE